MCTALFTPPEGMGSRQVQSVNEQNINEVPNDKPERSAAVDMRWNFGSETHKLLQSNHLVKTSLNPLNEVGC